MSTAEFEILKESSLKASILWSKRLIERTNKEDGELVFSKNGKIVHIKARNLK